MDDRFKYRVRAAFWAADREWRAVNEAEHPLSADDHENAFRRARAAALTVLAQAGADTCAPSIIALAERAAHQEADEDEVPPEPAPGERGDALAEVADQITEMYGPQGPAAGGGWDHLGHAAALLDGSSHLAWLAEGAAAGGPVSRRDLRRATTRALHQAREHALHQARRPPAPEPAAGTEPDPGTGASRGPQRRPGTLEP